MNEFELIRRWFLPAGESAPQIQVANGDDAAVLALPPGQALVSCVDTLVEGVHFRDTDPPESIGWRALAVNLSDLAAMGATPIGLLLALTLPRLDEVWLAGFSRGLLKIAGQHGCTLLGGDTTRGPRCISITALGQVADGRAIRRHGARVGDRVLVSGTLGDAALALAMPDPAPALEERRLWPTPRLALGQAMQGFAHAAIDVSDGLAQDLGHLLTACGLGATVHAERVPMSAAFRQHAGDRALALALSGGDDYELCLTVAPGQVDALRAAVEVPLSDIGEITAAPGLRVIDAGGATIDLPFHGHDHFRAESP